MALVKSKSLSSFKMECRLGCGACCIAPSISSPIPGMPKGKAAGIRCVQLDEDNMCKLFGLQERPKVCTDFAPEFEVCGSSSVDAIQVISFIENTTY